VGDAILMEYFEWFLYVWFGFALIKITITTGTMVAAFLEYRRNNDLRLSLLGSFAGLIILTVVPGVVIVVAWPIFLYDQRFGFFKFPDNIMKNFYLVLLKRINKSQ
jgi:hypothetical protein